MEKTILLSTVSSDNQLKKQAHNSSLILTGGDPAGISPEIIESVIPHIMQDKVPLVYFCNGSEVHITALKIRTHPEYPYIEITEDEALNRQFSEPALYVCRASYEKTQRIIPGSPSDLSGSLALWALSSAEKRIKITGCTGLITAPLSKYYVSQSSPDFTGHTGYLAQSFSCSVLMLMHGIKFSVIPLTIHIPLKEVPGQIQKEFEDENLTENLKLLLKTEVFSDSRWALTSVNPHGGEEGLMGTEEIEFQNDAGERLRKSGLPVDGPLPADGAFMDGIRQNYRLFLTAYHDQGLIPFKALEGKNGVNCTIGLPFLRLSPDHGTAYSIAGKGIADPQSMIRCYEVWKSGELSLNSR